MTRTLHFVRHGQYEHQDGVFGGALTRLGHRQARLVGKALAELPVRLVHVSDYNRARETADRIAAEVGAPIHGTPLLREMMPSAVPGLHVALADRADARERLEQIEARYLKPSRAERHEVVVCHGNLIRALVARCLRTPRTAWFQMLVHHAGLTSLQVRPDGRVLLERFNDVGHLPLECRTTQ